MFDGATAERRLAVVLRRGDDGLVRRVLARRTDRRGGRGHLCRAHAARQAAAAVAAGARSRRRDAGDRPGDARQSRTRAHAVGRAPRLAARRDRPHRDGGRLAAAGAAARRAADRSGRDRASARCRRGFRRRQRRARRSARASQSGARSGARAVAHRRRPRRAARSRRDPRRHCRGGGIFRAARRARRHAARHRAGDRGAAPARCRASPPNLQRALADELPAFRRDGGFVRAGYRAGARRSARAARRIAPRHRRAAGALRRDDRHPLAENPAQQCARLFRRRHRAARRQADERAAQRDLHPSPDARPARCASPPPNSANSKPRSPTPPTARWRSSWRFSIGLPRRVTAASAAIKEAADALAVARCRDRAGGARGRARLCAPRGRRQPCFRHHRRPPSGGRAGAGRTTAARSSPTIATLSPPARRQTGRPHLARSPARTWRANRRSCARTR